MHAPRKVFLLGFALLSSACVAARPARAAGPVYLPELLNEGLPGNGAYELLAQLCASAPHRLAGSDGAARAVEWARAAMERVGLERVHLEPCSVPHWERGSLAELVVVSPASHAGEALAVLALGGSVATPSEGIEAEVMAVTSFEELHARAAEARQKLVLFARPMDPTRGDPFEAYGGAVNQRTSGADEARHAGALGALVRSMTLRHDDEPHTGALRYESTSERVPAAALSTNAADQVSSWLAAGERVVLRLRLDCRWLDDVPSFNVVGELTGTEKPGEVVLLGAHLDCWDVGQGAHDDGSGCAHVLEAARLLAHSSLGRARRSVRCVLYMNEENGLRGGQAYREAHAGELDLHVLAIETDRGGDVPLGYTTDATGKAASVLGELFGAPVARGGGADISPLAEAGVPLAGLYPSPQRYFDYHHSRRDVLEAVHPRDLELGAIALASLARLAADRAGEWPRNPPAAAGEH